ncbi:ABC transporter substrate-binding protein [Burkholderia cepacia]|uniref:ABC transporter substrate-binding protein n=1 Tax=Burkholderia cepacia TaxID=292 RepID=UPI002349D9BD|nr:ABC transporter substrate-binding protein [Burkholderia cepacia]MDC6101320.1 ABC transporter substrate-binding protein [Burkholderia cepacia]
MTDTLPTPSPFAPKDPVRRRYALAAAWAAAGLGGAARVFAADTAAAPVRGGTLSLFAQPEPPSLVNALTPHVASQYVGGKIFQGLLGFDPQLRAVPVLARSWRASADALTYTFDLQPGVRWHDGQPFGAQDVVVTLKEIAPQALPRTKVTFDKYVASFDASGPLQVTIRLKKPYAGLINLLGSGLLPILPAHLYQGKDPRSNPANQHPVGTGPFVFREWKRGAYIRVARNPDYWKKGLPYLDGIVFNVVPDAAARSIAFERGQIHALRAGDVDYADIARLAKLPGVAITTQGWELFTGMAFLELNQRKPPFDNVLVRQAVLHALDRQFIVDRIFFGYGKVANGPFVSSSPFYDPNVPRFAYDPERARALIRQSGVDVGKFPLVLINGEKGGAWERVAEYTQQALGQAGFRLRVQTTDAAGWYARVANWDFDLSYNFLFQNADPDFGVAPLYRIDGISKGSPFGNVEGYRNPQADALWDAAALDTDPAARRARYAQLQTTLANDAAIANIFEMVNPTVYRRNVHNLLRTATSVNDSLEDTWIG